MWVAVIYLFYSIGDFVSFKIIGSLTSNANLELNDAFQRFLTDDRDRVKKKKFVFLFLLY